MKNRKFLDWGSHAATQSVSDFRLSMDISVQHENFESIWKPAVIRTGMQNTDSELQQVNSFDVVQHGNGPSRYFKVLSENYVRSIFLPDGVSAEQPVMTGKGIQDLLKWVRTRYSNMVPPCKALYMGGLSQTLLHTLGPVTTTAPNEWHVVRESSHPRLFYELLATPEGYFIYYLFTGSPPDDSSRLSEPGSFPKELWYNQVEKLFAFKFVD